MFKKTKGTHSLLGSLLLCAVATTFVVVAITAAKQYIGFSGNALGVKTQNKFHTNSTTVPEKYSDVETEIRYPR